jgi:hypothetical protein
MRRTRLCPLLVAVFILSLPGPQLTSAEPTPAERGREAVSGRLALNPPVWSRQAYDNVWKQWGLEGKPPAGEFDRMLRERYGLHVAPYDNGGLPMGLHTVDGPTGKGIGNDCLLCHAGRVAGQTIIGLGNASLDLQGIFEEMTAGDPLRPRVPFTFSHVRGTIDPVSPVTFLLAFRDPELNLQKPIRLDGGKYLCSDPPAWWLLKRKKTRDWTGNVDARSRRVDLATMLHPFNSAEYIRKHESTFGDIHAFVLGVEPPEYPFPIDKARATRGKKVFEARCSRCHGTYGPGGEYPNKVVPVAGLGTDPLLAESITEKTIAYLNKTWLAREKGPDGKPYRFTRHLGYQAPPLNGVWATAPYLHNGSVPTVYHLLKSEARPKVFTRSYGTEKKDYDPVRLGWKFTPLDKGPDPKLPGVQRRRVYDTTQPGRSNGGHPFGDKLTEPQRMAVIEYLKTL